MANNCEILLAFSESPRTSSGKGTKSFFAILTTIFKSLITNYSMLITKWEEKSSEIPDQKHFAHEKGIADDKLQVAEDIVGHKNLFFERIWSLNDSTRVLGCCRS